MIAQNKEHFVRSWNDVPNQLMGLTNSAETAETFAKIERFREELKALILEVANEAYPDDSNTCEHCHQHQEFKSPSAWSKARGTNLTKNKD